MYSVETKHLKNTFIKFSVLSLPATWKINGIVGPNITTVSTDRS
jgi:hypothetical protein